MLTQSVSTDAVRHCVRFVILSIALLAVGACGSSNRAASTGVAVPDIEGVHIAAHAGGRAIAVWQDFDGTRISVYASHYSPAGGWQTPLLLENDQAGDATLPRVAMNAAGVAFAVWQQSDGTRSNIWASRYDANTGLWQGATPIESDAGDAAHPEVAVDAHGNAFAVWQQSDGVRLNIVVGRYADGLGWLPPAPLENNDDGPATRPRVAMNAVGLAFAVWQQSDGTRDNIWANRYDNDPRAPGWQGATPIELDNAGGAERPDIAVDDGGNALAVWQQSNGSVFNAIGARYADGLGWRAPEALEADDTGDATHVRVAMNTTGDGYAIWQQSDGIRTNVWANRFNINVVPKVWQGAALVETDAGGAERPAIAVTAGGDAVAVWQQFDGVRFNIRRNRYAVGPGWGSPILVETADAGDAKNPRIALDDAANAYAVWLQSNGTRVNAETARFTP